MIPNPYFFIIAMDSHPIRPAFYPHQDQFAAGCVFVGIIFAILIAAIVEKYRERS